MAQASLGGCVFILGLCFLIIGVVWGTRKDVVGSHLDNYQRGQAWPIVLTVVGAFGMCIPCTGACNQ